MQLYRAAIDSDFFQKLTEFNKDGELFSKIMCDLGRRPVMHKYVAKEELLGVCSGLIEKLGIDIISCDDFLGDDPIQRAHYAIMFRDLYKFFCGCDFPDTEDVYTYTKKGESLGEIRTALMAVWENIDMFLSDDGAAKTNIMKHIHSSRCKIEVYNIYDTLLAIGNSHSRKLKWQDVKGLAKRMGQRRSNPQYYEDIKKTWIVST